MLGNEDTKAEKSDMQKEISPNELIPTLNFNELNATRQNEPSKHEVETFIYFKFKSTIIIVNMKENIDHDCIDKATFLYYFYWVWSLMAHSFKFKVNVKVLLNFLIFF